MIQIISALLFSAIAIWLIEAILGTGNQSKVLLVYILKGILGGVIGLLFAEIVILKVRWPNILAVIVAALAGFSGALFWKLVGILLSFLSIGFSFHVEIIGSWISIIISMILFYNLVQKTKKSSYTGKVKSDRLIKYLIQFIAALLFSFAAVWFIKLGQGTPNEGIMFLAYILKSILGGVIGLLFAEVVILKVRWPNILAVIVAVLAGFFGVIVGGLFGILLGALLTAFFQSWNVQIVTSWISMITSVIIFYNLVEKRTKERLE